MMGMEEMGLKRRKKKKMGRKREEKKIKQEYTISLRVFLNYDYESGD